MLAASSNSNRDDRREILMLGLAERTAMGDDGHSGSTSTHRGGALSAALRYTRAISCANIPRSAGTNPCTAPRVTFRDYPFRNH
jgi:hypothetical protein